MNSEDDERQLGYYLEYDDQGKIVATMNTAHVTAAALRDQGRLILMGQADPAESMVVDNEIVARPENPSRIESGRVVAIPPASFVWFKGERYPCDDGVLEIDTDEPGPLRLLIQSFPEKDKVIEIEIDP